MTSTAFRTSHRSPSTLDEETALAVALSISEEEAKKRETPIVNHHLEPVAERPAELATTVGALETAAYAPAEQDAGSEFGLHAANSPSDYAPPLDKASPSSRDDGEYAAFEPDHALLEKIQGAKTRRHILRQNSINWSHEESLGDKDRLLENLALYGLIQKEVKGDGNCQFRAISDQLYQTPKFYSEVRQQVFKQLKSHTQLYADFADDDYHSYVSNMAKDGTWGDHITLQAAADVLGVRILIVSSYQEECIIEILPHLEQPSVKTLYLSFWHEVHYGSIYPSGSRVPEETPKTFGSKHLYRFIHKPAVQHPGVVYL